MRTIPICSRGNKDLKAAIHIEIKPQKLKVLTITSIWMKKIYKAIILPLSEYRYQVLTVTPIVSLQRLGLFQLANISVVCFRVSDIIPHLVTFFQL